MEHSDHWIMTGWQYCYDKCYAKVGYTLFINEEMFCVFGLGRQCRLVVLVTYLNLIRSLSKISYYFISHLMIQ
jgi:hypothetical protein